MSRHTFEDFPFSQTGVVRFEIESPSCSASLAVNIAHIGTAGNSSANPTRRSNFRDQILRVLDIV